MPAARPSSGARLTPPFWFAVLATVAIAIAADAPWLELGGLTVDGQSGLVRLAVPIDTVWVYGAAGVSGFGLLIVLLTRRRAAYLLPAAAGIATVAIVVIDFADLYDGIEDFTIGGGAFVTAGAALILALVSLAGFAGKYCEKWRIL